MNRQLATLAIAFAAIAARADFIPENEVFVGVDGLQTIATGTYAGLANPNFGRLTLLYGHQYDGSEGAAPETSPYHSKAIYTYSGSAASPKVITSASNYLPEGANPPLDLLAGSGALSGYRVSGLEDRHFANTTLRPTSWLNRPGAALWETTTFGSSGGRWAGSLGNANLSLEVVGLTSGLSILAADGSVLADSAGDALALGSGDFAVTPIFAVGAAASGSYVARMRLRDLSGTFGDSGVFEYRFNASPVPEPASMVALGLGAATMLRRRKKD